LIALFLLMTFVIVTLQLFGYMTQAKDPNAPAAAFVPQVFTAALTLATAVSSFYFGSRVAQAKGAPAAAALAVANIDPRSGHGNVFVTNLSGTGFAKGAQVRLTQKGQPDIPAGKIDVVDDTRIICVFDVSSAAVGKWNVVVTNPDGTLAQGENLFEVEKTP
jgi:hypothetical protein